MLPFRAGNAHIGPSGSLGPSFDQASLIRNRVGFLGLQLGLRSSFADTDLGQLTKPAEGAGERVGINVAVEGQLTTDELKQSLLTAV